MSDLTTVYVITELGPTDGPGLLVPAQLSAMAGAFRVYRYTPPDDFVRHPNNRCHPRPTVTPETS